MGAVLGLVFGVGLVLALGVRLPTTARSPKVGSSRTRRDLDAAGLAHVRVRSLWLLSAGGAVLAFTLLLVASRTLPIAVVFAGLATFLPIGLVRGRARRRQRDFAEVWPEVVDNLNSAVRAGMSLPEALGALADRGPEPLRESFARFALDYQVTGQFSPSLDRLKTHLSDPVGDRVVEALRVAREVGGGDLGRLLRSLSGYLREDARTRSELESRQAWTVNGARLAVAAPWLVLLFLCFQPEVIQRYSSPLGATVLVGGAIACVGAYRLMMWLGRLPTERRILQ